MSDISVSLPLLNVSLAHFSNPNSILMSLVNFFTMFSKRVCWLSSLASVWHRVTAVTVATTAEYPSSVW